MVRKSTPTPRAKLADQLTAKEPCGPVGPSETCTTASLQYGLSRRGLLGNGVGLAGLAGLALVGQAWAAPGTTGARAAGAASSGSIPEPSSPDAVPSTGGARARGRRAREARLAAADLQQRLPETVHATNGDERSLPGFLACHSKGLPHNHLGEVDAAAYRLMLHAMETGNPADFEAIPLGGFVKLANPQAGLAFNLIGPDPASIHLGPPPSFASAEQGAELVELYWQALLRDVPFATFDSHPLARQAAAELSRLADFKGPRDGGGQVTPQTLFRGASAANLTGPYLSQFLYRDIFLPPMWVQQRVRTAVPGLDYLTVGDHWLACQNGAIEGINTFDPQPRYIRNGRDLGEFVHRDFSYQAALDACLVLLKIGAPVNGGNPYKHSRTQSAFTTFGAPNLFFLLAVVTQAALTASWYQKWYIHRRLRPEEYAGRVELHRSARARYPLPQEALGSEALTRVLGGHATALLPQAYPEGCPLHPSYPAAHAVIASAGTTVLKAFFDESYLVTNPVVPTPDGLALQPFSGPPLSIGCELDKLAWNIGMGRNFAGIHWRSDVANGLDLGERVAIAVLREIKLTGNELFAGFSLRRLDGQRLTI